MGSNIPYQQDAASTSCKKHKKNSPEGLCSETQDETLLEVGSWTNEDEQDKPPGGTDNGGGQEATTPQEGMVAEAA